MSLCNHGFDPLVCKQCPKDAKAFDVKLVKEGKFVYGTFLYRDDGKYDIRDLIGKPYKIKSAAEKACAAHNAKYNTECVVRFVPAKSQALDRIRAKVKWWNDAKGYGFLEVPGRRLDVFAHYTAIYADGFKTLVEGSEVLCEICDGPKGPQALKIYKLD